MRHFLGIDARSSENREKHENVFYDTSAVLNSHGLICGMSGTGKSYQSMQLLDSAAKSGVEIDIFDVHEELDGVIGARACRYSQATGFGYNPLVLDTDPHTGGVTRQIDVIIKQFGDVSPLGIKQVSCLRSLLTDVYAAQGIFQNSPDTWNRAQMSETQRQQFINGRRWDELRRYYPTLEDLKSYAKRKLSTLMIGGDEPAAHAFEELNTCLRALNKANSKYGRGVSQEQLDKLEAQLETAKLKYNEAVQAWSSALSTGKEFEDVIRYDSADVLSGILDRIDSLNSAGIFRANDPPFGNAKVRVHQIKSLTDEQQVLFVRLRLRAIFDKCKRQGPTPPGQGNQLRHLVFLDEAHKFFKTSGGGESDIVSIIAKEARKFGLGLWCASQSPEDFPRGFTSNVGFTMLLGINALFWKSCISNLRIAEETLAKIKAKEVIAIRMQRDGEANPPFQTIVVPNITYTLGRVVASYREKIMRQAA